MEYISTQADYEYLFRTLCFIDFPINNAKEYIILNITITTVEFMFERVLLDTPTQLLARCLLRHPSTSNIGLKRWAKGYIDIYFYILNAADIS